MDLGLPQEKALKDQSREWAYNYAVTANGKTYLLSCKDTLGSNDRDRQAKLSAMLLSPAKSKDISITSGQSMDQFKNDFFKTSEKIAPPGESPYVVHADIAPMEVKTVPKKKA